MKIFNFGLSIDPGKYKYKPECLDKLAKKFSPKEITPYLVEFLDTDLEICDSVVFNISKRLDFILIDLEKIENRLLRVENEEERTLLNKATELLEKEILLSEAEFSEQEKETLRLLQLVTGKPSLGFKQVEDINELIREVIDRAGIILFFTANKKEVRAWGLKKGLPVLEAAGKIHSDLKRGFIKAEVLNCSQLDNFFNLAEARPRGFLKVVGKDYIVEDKDIIEIKFNL